MTFIAPERGEQIIAGLLFVCDSLLNTRPDNLIDSKGCACQNQCDPLRSIKQRLGPSIPDTSEKTDNGHWSDPGITDTSGLFYEHRRK